MYENIHILCVKHYISFNCIQCKHKSISHSIMLVLLIISIMYYVSGQYRFVQVLWYVWKCTQLDYRGRQVKLYMVCLTIVHGTFTKYYIHQFEIPSILTSFMELASIWIIWHKPKKYWEYPNVDRICIINKHKVVYKSNKIS